MTLTGLSGKLLTVLGPLEVLDSMCECGGKHYLDENHSELIRICCDRCSRGRMFGRTEFARAVKFAIQDALAQIGIDPP